MQQTSDSVETPYGWTVATASLLLMSIGFGAQYVAIVGLKPMAAEFNWPRSIPSLIPAMAQLGAGVGGIFMGWWADRAGPRRPVMLGAVMMGLGALLASQARGAFDLYLTYGLLIGALGNGTTFAPLMSNITRWFDKNRGVALSIVASGQSVAGGICPPLFRWGIDTYGWRATLICYGIFSTTAMLPLAFLLRRPPPPAARRLGAAGPAPRRELPLNPVLAQTLLSIAIVGCCVAMAMPIVHTVAFCSDLGYAPARGAEMLSLLLAVAFISRMFWGRLSDRIGGLKTIFIGSAAQAITLACYMLVDGLVALYVLSAAFGLAFGGIVPAYSLVVRDLFPARDAGWRIGIVYLSGTIGMALGGWIGGLVFDMFLRYQPAFGVGVFFNVVNLAAIGTLMVRLPRLPRSELATTQPA
ncbi:MAG: MFS transporter [Proteobacteria bacterium]|nr:MFS transporter [Pseudomonadota bacterium]MBI3496213.1 MFS transporter [Pseudomonadota bacterium]